MRRKNLSLEDMVAAASMVLERKMLHSDVAKHFRKTTAAISALMCRLRKNPSLLSELISQRNLRLAERHKIQDFILEKVEKDEFIDSTKKMQRQINASAGLEVKQHLVRDVMGNDLGLRYKKVVGIPIHANSDTNLVLRQQWALMYLDLITKRKRIINIDETWLGTEDYRRFKWQPATVNNSVAKKLWQPRISLILAIDNFGERYISVSLSNTNSKVIMLFMRELAVMLG